jgi:glycosyltransferase involved in cell wall biosynthesis
MRVLHIVPAAFEVSGAIGGAERYALSLAVAMSRQVPTRLVTFGDHPRSWMEDGLPARVLPGTHSVNGQRWNPLSGYLLGELRQADVVHCHQQHVLCSSLSALLGRGFRRRVVATDHAGGGLDFSWYFSTDSWFHRLLHVSAFSRTIAGQNDNSRASVISAGVDTMRFARRQDSEDRVPRALFVGRLLPHKGVHDLIEALPPDVGLDIVGPELDEAYASVLRGIAADRPDVAFLGVVPETELVRLYQRALCTVLPSVYKNPYGAPTAVPELLGQALLETMSCGTPAICTDVGGMPETLLDGHTGYVVPPGDPTSLRRRLEELAADHELVDRLGRRAGAHIRATFTWEVVAARCLAAYRSI